MARDPDLRYVRVQVELEVMFLAEDYVGTPSHELEERAIAEVRAQLRTGHEVDGYYNTMPADEAGITAREIKEGEA